MSRRCISSVIQVTLSYKCDLKRVCSFFFRRQSAQMKNAALRPARGLKEVPTIMGDICRGQRVAKALD